MDGDKVHDNGIALGGGGGGVPLDWASALSAPRSERDAARKIPRS